MRNAIGLFVIGLLLATAACTDARRARNSATFGDQPADITCWTYGVETFTGRSTGKVEYNDGGRIAFVDASNNRYTTVDGECRVVYLNEGDRTAAPETLAPTAPTASVPGT
jgi:hypothetical protein